jgi:hypothetical protein
MLVHHPPLLSAHRIHLDRVPSTQSLLSSSIRPRSKRLPAPLAISSRINDHPFPLSQPPESRLISQKLQGVNSLPPLPDQQPVVLIPINRGRNPVILLGNLDLTVKVQLIEHPLDKLPNPLRRPLRPILGLTHARQSMPESPSSAEQLTGRGAEGESSRERATGDASSMPREAAPGKVIISREAALN